MSDNRAIAAAYDLWAASYDSDENRTRDRAGAVLRAAEIAFTGRTVVEIGCGTGRNTQWLSERASHVLALDLSEGMLAQARARVVSPHVRFEQHDITLPWPIADAAADIVVASLVLEHVPQLAAIFGEVRRVLTPGGEFFMVELHPTRQMLGRQAVYSHPQTGERQPVPAFMHDVADYVNGGIAAGLRLLALHEWRDAGADFYAAPRLLSIRFGVGSA